MRKWESLCLGRKFPVRSAFGAEAMGVLWPHMFILDVRAGLQESHFDYCGPVFASACGGQILTDKPLSGSLPETLWENMPYAFQAVVNTKKPLIASRHAGSPAGADFPYRCVVAPAGDGEAVDYLAAAFSYRRPDWS